MVGSRPLPRTAAPTGAPSGRRIAPWHESCSHRRARRRCAGTSRPSASPAGGGSVVVSAHDLVQMLTQVLLLAIFGRVTIAVVLRPNRTNFDIALLFAG